MTYVKKLLGQIGLEEERLDMVFIASSEGAHFAEICTEITERIRRLGPNPLGKSGHVPSPNSEGGLAE